MSSTEKKKKKGANKGTNSAVGKVVSADNDVNSLQGTSEIRSLLRSFYQARKRSIDLLENIINLLNKQTYFQRNRINEIVSPLVPSSSFASLVDEEMILHLSSLRETRAEILELLKQIQTSWDNQKTNLSETIETISSEFIEEVISQIIQQSALDESISDQLLLYPYKQRSQDELVTMASCLKLSPYLDEKNLKCIIDTL